MSFRHINASGDDDNQLDWGKIAMYSGIAVVVGAAIYLVFKKKK